MPHATLVRLPPELLLCVFDELSNEVDRVCLRFACKRFRCIYPRIKITFAPARAELLSRFLRDLPEGCRLCVRCWRLLPSRKKLYLVVDGKRRHEIHRCSDCVKRTVKLMNQGGSTGIFNTESRKKDYEAIMHGESDIFGMRTNVPESKKKRRARRTSQWTLPEWVDRAGRRPKLDGGDRLGTTVNRGN